MVYRLALVGILAAIALSPALAQRAGLFGEPRVSVRPLPRDAVFVAPTHLFATTPSFVAAGAEFFPTAPTTLFNNTNTTGYYFPVSNLTLDDVNIPVSLDTDNDGTYYLTQIDVAIYLTNLAQQPVQMEVYIANADAFGDVDLNTVQQIGSFNEQLSPGGWIISFSFPRCQPLQQSTVTVYDAQQNPYGRFWIGVKFPQYCAPLYSGNGPGWLTANGPDAQADVFYWQGDTNCQGTYGAGYYHFGGNPRGSFYIKVLGAATLADAIVVDPDVNGDRCVNDADLLEVLFNFGATGSNLADVNCDGTVNDADLLEVLFNFGSGC